MPIDLATKSASRLRGCKAWCKGRANAGWAQHDITATLLTTATTRLLEQCGVDATVAALTAHLETIRRMGDPLLTQLREIEAEA